MDQDLLYYADGTPVGATVCMKGIYPLSIGSVYPGTNWIMLTPNALPKGVREVSLKEAGVLS